MKIPNNTVHSKRYTLFLTISVFLMLAGSILLRTGAADSEQVMPAHHAKPSRSESPAAKAGVQVDSASASELAAAFDRGRAVEVMATGYTAGVESTGKSPGHPKYGVTFSGVKVRKGKFSTIAADPKLFPIGTIMYIPGYGYGVVADTGSAIKGNKIDLYYDTVKDVFTHWGKKKVKVIVLKKGDGQVTETMLDRLNAINSFRAEMPPVSL